MTDLVIIGAGGFGREIYHAHVKYINQKIKPTWNVIGFIDEKATSTPEGIPVLGNLEDFLKMDRKIQYFIGIADMAARARIAKRCREAGFTSATLIGPECIIAPDAEIGEGTIIAGGTTLMKHAKVGSFCIVQGSSCIWSGAEIGDYTSVMTSSYFGRNVKIGKYNYFGLRCNVADGVTTTENCTFGACASVLEDATVPGTYVGVPAVLKKPLVR